MIAPDGGLAEFITVGIPPDGVAHIGDLPQGKGLLGALIDDPAPIRLHRIADDPRSSGFPPGHPPTDSFLGLQRRAECRGGHLSLEAGLPTGTHLSWSVPIE